MMGLIERLRERSDDSDIGYLLRHSDDTQLERLTGICQNTWNDWIENNAIFCEGKRKERVCRDLGRKAMNKARLCGIYGDEPRVGFWEVIVLNVAIMIIKWLWDKWMEGE